jgi:ribosomal peptide maturation radical SAM protein 1
MIYLINMPFASLINPNLALSQFKVQLNQAGLSCRLLNLGFDFAAEIGVKSYEAFARRRGVDTQIGEWFFAKLAWDGKVDLSPDVFVSLCGVNPAYLKGRKEPLDWLRFVRDEVVPRFIEKSCDRLFEDGPPRVVGFSCTFYQTISSLALAKAVKARNPATKIVFGGACFHAGMGRELFQKVPFIDAVSTGEADDVVVDLFRALSEGRDPEGLHGILYRKKDGTLGEGPEHRPVSSEVLESIPDPDFDDFAADLEGSGLVKDTLAGQRVFLPFESSRGCWWGQKKHCVFCGLNADSMVYRKKSATRVRGLFESYLRRYPFRRFFATDNNMPRQFYKDLLPDMGENPLPGKPLVFYEVKPNVTRREMEVMAAAGVRYTQPGIESLSTSLLKHMRKGCSAMQNLYYLKLCRTYFIFPMWNFLVSVPGERLEDYEAQARLIPKIVHFYPPYSGIRLMQIHRFSPYFNEAEKYTDSIRPKPWYQGLFPKDTVDINEVAYYFEAEWKQVIGRNQDDYAVILNPILAWIDCWKKEPELPGLSYHVLDMDGLELNDTRFEKKGIWKLTADEARVYRAIDDPAGLEKLENALGENGKSVTWLKGLLDEFVKHGLAFEENGQYLGLALPDTAPSLSLSYRQLFLAQEEKNIKDRRE